MSDRRVQLGELPIGAGAPLVLIAGPCVLESEDFTLKHAERVQRIAAKRGVPLVFKASFDKANRTKGDSARGPGLEAGLSLLAKVKAQLGLPLLTDVHLPQQCAPAAEVVDVLQIPAFLCRQTDLIAAAGQAVRAHGGLLNIKKGQFLAAEDMGYAVEKAEGAPCMLTERGSSFGYRDLVVDYRSLEILARFGPVVFDGTHSVQRPGAAKGKTGGNRAQVPALARAAVAVGVDALFLEVHPDPDRAPSDGPNSLDYAGLDRILLEARALRETMDTLGAQTDVNSP